MGQHALEETAHTIEVGGLQSGYGMPWHATRLSAEVCSSPPPNFALVPTTTQKKMHLYPPTPTFITCV